MTLSDLEQLRDGTYKIKPKGGSAPEKVGKYRSRKIEFDGEKYDSKKEFCRHRELKFLLKIGEISELKRQVVYQLSVCKYVCDFEYLDKSGNLITEDVKSPATRKNRAYRIKNKLMFHELGIKIKEV